MTLSDSAWASKRPSRHNPRSNKTHNVNPQVHWHAPQMTTSQAQASDSTHDHVQSLQRLRSRVEWKATILLTSLQQFHQTYHCHPQPQSPSHDDPSHDRQGAARETTTQIRLDFFEFYTLLERGIVLALALVGVRLSRSLSSAPRVEGDGIGAAQADMRKDFIFNTTPPIHRHNATSTLPSATTSTTTTIALDPTTSDSHHSSKPRASHNYHAAILTLLSDPTCLLHAALGTGDVFLALTRAKSLRNRWKEHSVVREVPVLDVEALDTILRLVVGGLGHAVRAVEEYVAHAGGNQMDDVNVGMEVEMVDVRWEREEVDWCEAVEDGMEWE